VRLFSICSIADFHLAGYGVFLGASACVGVAFIVCLAVVRGVVEPFLLISSWGRGFLFPKGLFLFLWTGFITLTIVCFWGFLFLLFRSLCFCVGGGYLLRGLSLNIVEGSFCVGSFRGGFCLCKWCPLWGCCIFTG